MTATKTAQTALAQPTVQLSDINVLPIGTIFDTGLPFGLPTDRIATRKGFVIGQGGAGKTYATARVVEGLMDLGITVLVFDLVNMWSGLALDREGTRAAYPIAIFGGKRGHHPLTADMGAAIAKTVYNERWSTVINLSGMTEADQFSVTADIVRRTFELHDDQPKLTVLVFEEFHRFCPETLTGTKNHALVSSEIVRASDMGRNNGLGMLGISLRPQDIKNRILAQADWRLWMRMQELGAISTATKYLNNAAEIATVGGLSKELVHLQTGTGFFESPSWMEWAGKIQVGERRTFHRDPEKQIAMDDSVLARAVDVNKLRSVFAGFQVESERELTAADGAPEFVPAAVEKGTRPTSSDRSDVNNAKAGKAQTLNIKAATLTVSNAKQVRELEKENEALRRAYDDLTVSKQQLEQDVDQRIRFAEEAAAREADMQIQQLRAQVQQALSIFQAIPTPEILEPLTGSSGRMADDGNGDSRALTTAVSNALSKLRTLVTNNEKLTGTQRAAVIELIDEYAYHPLGISKTKLAARLSIKTSSLRKNVLPRLVEKMYIVVDGETVGLNPKQI